MMALGLLIGAGCEKEKLPSRDEIPILRERVYKLEQAVLHRSTAEIDSLASAEMLERGLSADSLLGLVYGPDRDRPFAKFDNYTIFYDRSLALVTCDIADSTADAGRPVKLIYHKYGDRWLLRSFQPAADSSAAQ